MILRSASWARTKESFIWRSRPLRTRASTFGAKSRKVPLWKLLIDLTPQQVVRVLDLSYLDEVLCEREALNLLSANVPRRPERTAILEKGYPGYDTQ